MSARPISVRLHPFVGFVGFVGMAMLPACQADDLSSLSERIGAFDPSQFEGEFVTRIADYDDGTSRISHHVVRGPEGVEIDVDPADYPELEIGATVRLLGERLDDTHFHVDGVELIAGPPQQAIDPTPRELRRIALIMVRFGDTGGLDKEAAKAELFTGNSSTNLFYQEGSYGMDKLTGNVFGPFQVPTPTGCNMQGLATNAQEAMADAGYKLDEFEQFMYWFPNYSGCSWAGLANVGAPNSPARDSWYNGSFGCVVRAQELGHNYGMLHSHSLSCRDENGELTPYSNQQTACSSMVTTSCCSESEYGDPYDPMGSGCGHMNVVQKAYMDWLQGCNIVATPTSGTFTFNLMPTELPCNGTQALRIPMEAGSNRSYYLEYRQPIGVWDKKMNLNGVLVHVAGNYNGSPNVSILDMKLDGPGAFMKAGDSYTDYLDRVTFTVLEEHPTHAVIEVAYPNAGTEMPTCEGGSAPAMENGHWGSLECAVEPVPFDNVKPTVEITYPSDGDVLEPGTSFDITAEAFDERGIIEVELYVDGEPIQKDYTEPYSWHVSNIPMGEYEFGVVARDGVNWAPSQAVTIKVGIPEGTTGTSTDGPSETDTSMPATETGNVDPDTGDETDTTGPMETGTSDGCSCRQSPASAPTALALLMIAAGLRRRRH